MKTTTASTFGERTPDRKEAIRIFQYINNGSVKGVLVRNRKLVFDPPEGIFRTVIFPGDNAPRSAIFTPNFVLKSGIREFFDYLDKRANVDIHVIKIGGSLPLHMRVEERSLVLHLSKRHVGAIYPYTVFMLPAQRKEYQYDKGMAM